jgi:formylglycine-generating enzyme required for sulfatase activity
MTKSVAKTLCDECGTPYAVSETHCPECGLKRPHLVAAGVGSNGGGAGTHAAVASAAPSPVHTPAPGGPGATGGAGPARRFGVSAYGGAGVAAADPPSAAPRQRRASSKVPAAAAVLTLGLLVLGVGGWYWYDPTPAGMVYVKGGRFMMGRDDGDEFERPAHEVVVRPFYIDKSEVTCEQYEKFVGAEGHRPPPTWGGAKCPAGAARLPVTGVNWDDANAYARWNGKRLPTEEEWEFVARGEEGRLYPWGNRWEAGMANAMGDSGGGLAEVSKFKGVSPLGVYDLIGNAWEWTASDLESYPGGRLPRVPEGELKVIRGGSWREGEYVTGSYRAYLKPHDDEDYSATGFRCARDAER